MKPKILLIEDDMAAIDIYEKVLKKAGFLIEALRMGAEGLERLTEIKEGKKEKPDLVLLDLILPDIDGIKILEKAKKEKETKDIPFLVLTNYIGSNTKKLVEKIGAEKYIVKTNVTPLQLVRFVKKYSKK